MHACNYTQLFSAFPNLEDRRQLSYRTTNGFDIDFNTAVCNHDRFRMSSVGMIGRAVVRFVSTRCTTAADLD
jgi:hypothetical protein